ncbi:hypothetical protein AC1031_008980 [Aphanomyces cochlioides]|nr:hypothetical protein AC1031_008980 [Aphanomyces cochlioides]
MDEDDRLSLTLSSFSSQPAVVYSLRLWMDAREEAYFASTPVFEQEPPIVIRQARRSNSVTYAFVLLAVAGVTAATLVALATFKQSNKPTTNPVHHPPTIFSEQKLDSVTFPPSTTVRVLPTQSYTPTENFGEIRFPAQDVEPPSKSPHSIEDRPSETPPSSPSAFTPDSTNAIDSKANLHSGISIRALPVSHKELVRDVNFFRTAVGLDNVTWDNNEATRMASWGETCLEVNEPQVIRVMVTSLTPLLRWFMDGHKLWNYTSQTCNASRPNNACYNFEQLMGRHVKRIGCSWSLCPDGCYLCCSFIPRLTNTPAVVIQPPSNWTQLVLAYLQLTHDEATRFV